MEEATMLMSDAPAESGDAIGQLVQRHIDLVYSAARRQLRDSHLAEDVTQAVFIVLARKGDKVRPEWLTGWLLRTTRLACLDVIKMESRRRKHEREAAAMAATTTNPDAREEHQELVSRLDAAMSRLNDEGRSAVALRFFEGRSLREVGDLMGISEEAARHRVDRAVGKLRQFLRKGGCLLPAAAVPLLLGKITEAAPPGLAAATHASVIAATDAGAATAGVAIAEGVIRIMTIIKAKIVAAVVAAVLLGTVATTVVVERVRAQQGVPAQPATTQSLAIVKHHLQLRWVARTPEETTAAERMTLPQAMRQPDETELAVMKEVLMDETAVANAQAVQPEQGRGNSGWLVNFEFTESGASRFGQLTEANIDRQLAIVLDGKLLSAPRIRSKIMGSGQIAGSFTRQEAEAIAAALGGGAPATRPARQPNPPPPAEAVNSYLEAAMANDAAAARKVFEPRAEMHLDDIRKVYTAPAPPTLQVIWAEDSALVYGTPTKDDRGREGCVIFTLGRKKGTWLIRDIDFRSEVQLADRLAEFRKSHPTAQDWPGQ